MSIKFLGLISNEANKKKLEEYINKDWVSEAIEEHINDYHLENVVANVFEDKLEALVYIMSDLKLDYDSYDELAVDIYDSLKECGLLLELEDERVIDFRTHLE